MSSVASVGGRYSTPLPANGGTASKADRLDALHRMSGTLTHDLNNLLGVIVSANERLADELGDGSEPQKLALLALEAAERGAELLRRSLALVREHAPAPDAIDCKALLDTLRRIASQAVAPGISFKVYELAQPLRWAGDRTGLEMALLNLCLNASQATPHGGSIVVQAREVDLSELEARRIGVQPGAFAAFTVRDAGKGMPPETLARATDPLFTTKETGSGLGLSSVVDFAEAAGGALGLQSREGHGTAATIYLPLAATAQAAVAV
jgi:signal transduction histidine kinase